jgi:hypothetical protein
VFSEDNRQGCRRKYRCNGQQPREGQYAMLPRKEMSARVSEIGSGVWGSFSPYDHSKRQCNYRRGIDPGGQKCRHVGYNAEQAVDVNDPEGFLPQDTPQELHIGNCDSGSEERNGQKCKSRAESDGPLLMIGRGRDFTIQARIVEVMGNCQHDTTKKAAKHQEWLFPVLLSMTRLWLSPTAHPGAGVSLGRSH